MNENQQEDFAGLSGESNGSDEVKPTEETVSSDAGDSGKEQSGGVTLTGAEYAELQAKVQELEDVRDKLMRSAADFENAKKRLAREKEEYVKFGQERFIKNLLPVLDNLERAIAHARSEENNADKTLKGLLSGIEMVQKQLHDSLKSQGLKRVEALNQTFDPHLHEALAFVQEEGKEDEVIDEIEAGYMLHDRLIRAAKVRVRVAPAAENKE